MRNMIRQIMALFDEYQSKENAKHTLRAMKENARQGFWNAGACRLPHCGSPEQRGHRTKKTLEIDPIQAEKRLIGAYGVKSIAKHLNEASIRTRDGGRWGLYSPAQSMSAATASTPSFGERASASRRLRWPKWPCRRLSIPPSSVAIDTGCHLKSAARSARHSASEFARLGHAVTILQGNSRHTNPELFGA
jgi:hypothetical protein